MRYQLVEELVKDTSSKKMIITKIAVEWWLMSIKSFQINLKILLYFFMISLLYLLKIFLKMQWKFTNIEQWNHFLNIPLLHLYLICSWYLFHQGLLLGSVKLKRVIYGESAWFFHIKKIMRLFLFCEFLINQFIFWQVFLISTFPFFSAKMFYVLHFVNENVVESVPSTWVEKKDGKTFCRWPKKDCRWQDY